MRGRLASLRRVARHALRVQRPIVLMYHRVEKLDVDPWQLAVTPERFADQIAQLTKTRKVVPLSWLAEELTAGRFPRNVAVVTFDDGYGDVFRNALPILEAAGCPATVFITTGALGSAACFWWDILARILLETPSLPDWLEFSIEGKRRRFWIGVNEADKTTALMDIHALLRPIAPDVRDAALAELASSAGTDAVPRERDLPMLPDQMIAMASSGLIEIGAHTVTHPPMTALEPREQLHEVLESRRLCEQLLGQPVQGFAYPYGDFDARAQEVLAEAGCTHACAIEYHAVRRGTDPFRIPRLLAANYDAQEFREQVLSRG